MRPDWKIDLACNGDDGISFAEMLQSITSRPDADCESAWEFFDEHEPESMMLTIERFATLGWSTQQIYAWVWEQMKKVKPLAEMRDSGKEMLALCIERAVRKYSNALVK